MVKTKTLKGFRDFLPEEAIKRQWLEQKIRSVFELWGYDPIETPTLEPLEIFEGEIGEDEKLFYKFKDAGGRDVALRYDQSVPASRVVGQNYQSLPIPFKRYQIQPAFRAEKPQKGRYREFLQCDADIFGIPSPLADAEIIALSLDIYKRLGFQKAKALINDRSLMKDIPYEAIVSIDKLKKVGKEKVISEMTKRNIQREKAEEYLGAVLKLKPSKEVQVILDYLDSYGFEKDWYEFDPTIARSFSYSTGPIWEIVVEGFERGSVLGGERFDQLTKRISGTDVPAVGFGLGFDRTLEAAEELGLLPKKLTNAKVLVTVFNEENFNKSLETASTLRNKNINTDLYPDNAAKLDKQLKYADKKNIPFVIIIGPDEVEKNTVQLKNMYQESQEELSLDRVIKRLQD